MRWEEIPGKTKTEYQNARKNSFDLFFGNLTKKSDMFILNESKTQYTTDFVPVEISIGSGAATMNYTYSNIIINLTDGAIRGATYDLSRAYLVGGYTQLETYRVEVNFIGSTTVDIPNV